MSSSKKLKSQIFEQHITFIPNDTLITPLRMDEKSQADRISKLLSRLITEIKLMAYGHPMVLTEKKETPLRLYESHPIINNHILGLFIHPIIESIARSKDPETHQRFVRSFKICNEIIISVEVYLIAYNEFLKTSRTFLKVSECMDCFTLGTYNKLCVLEDLAYDAANTIFSEIRWLISSARDIVMMPTTPQQDIRADQLSKTVFDTAKRVLRFTTRANNKIKNHLLRVKNVYCTCSSRIKRDTPETLHLIVTIHDLTNCSGISAFRANRKAAKPATTTITDELNTQIEKLFERVN